MTQDMLFDTAEIARQAVAATVWDGRCPLRYTTGFHTPDELDAALARWRAEHGDLACFPTSHMWHPSLCSPPMTFGNHQLHMYRAAARCDLDHDHSKHPLPGQAMSQAICTPCRWHHIDPDENTTVKAWHDHAMPGWRTLPVMPHSIAQTRYGRHGTGTIAQWAQDNYPPHWLVDNAPILTIREPGAGRAVPGYSPLGGYDLPLTMEPSALPEGTRP